MSPLEPQVDGPGLHEERTRLAWQRTAVTGTALGVGAVCIAVRRHDRYVLWEIAVLVVACAAAAVLAGERRAERAPEGVAFVADRPEGRLPSPWRRLVATACVPVLLGVGGVLLALSDPTPVIEGPHPLPGTGHAASPR